MTTTGRKELTLDEYLTKRPVDEGEVEQLKSEMLAEVRAYSVRELRTELGMTQRRLAELIGVGQNRISQIEHGNIDSVRLDTLRRYVEALGNQLEVVVRRPDGTRVPLGLD